MIAITMGDPAGIGPEVLAKALKHPAVRKGGPFCIIGDKAVLKRYTSKLPDNCDLFDLKRLNEDTVKPGQGTVVSAQASLAYLQAAVNLLKRKDVSALVTAPVHKENICKSGLFFEGHTEFLARAFHREHVEMMFVARDLRVVLLTRHIPLKRVSRSITAESLLATLQRSQQTLRTQFGIPKPRIAVCGLNPHAGEGGHIGDEEIRVIIPALAAAKKKKIRAEGPFAADTLFTPHQAQHFDLIIAMYHDQGLTGIKALCLNNLVNFTAGLPFIRTSPAHGTAFDIAGKGSAHPGSMTAAIRLADQLTHG
ncbi:MAG: 4-hydroxythreonine-4-phosphate dehydrogenase PdxA [Candidatus Omnitrophica bacterium]|nr:4-hydroxythreonine-4-phosphate dehydrogenase PdxA [Candidatus Omnitrophota bacterium]HQP12393.1 4-hydroxythreonine-4-phosphate dehydrogenase PdxA [Candidatus Omnitrophota bacterium]